MNDFATPFFRRKWINRGGIAGEASGRKTTQDKMGERNTNKQKKLHQQRL